MKRLLSLLLSFTVLFQVSPIQAQEESVDATIFYTNDVHGYVTDDGKSTIGLAKLATLKKDTPNSILVDAGDATQGLPIASLSKGSDIIELMNMTGYDAMTLGNHEFDFGLEQLLSNISKAGFPVLSSNTMLNGNLLTKDQTILEVNGLKIGIFGLTTTETKSATNPEGTQGVEFLEEIQTATDQVQTLEDNDCDVIVALAHLGNMAVSCTSKNLAENVSGIDVIIDGHSHTLENETVNDTLIVQTQTSLNHIGKIDITKEDDQVMIENELLSYEDVQDVTPDAEVLAKIDQINQSQSEILSQEVGHTNTSLWAGWMHNVSPTRIVETNFGDLVTDAFKVKAQEFLASNQETIPVVAVENGGGIREKIANGTITKGQLVGAFPFSNTLYMKKVTPSILYQMMAQSGVCMDGQDLETGRLLQTNISGGFLQVSGMNVVFDANLKQVTSIQLDGQDDILDPNDNTTEILLVSNNYIMSGGNDYSMLAPIEKYGELGGELEIIEDYIQKTDMSKYAKPQKRIQYSVSGYTPNSYQATVQIKDKEGKVIPNYEVSFMVDGNDIVKGTTDENGYIHLTLQDGSHSVKIHNESDEVYVDNYTGIGLIEDENIQGSFPVLTTNQPVNPEPTPDPEPTPEPKPTPETPDKEEGSKTNGTKTSTETNETMWFVLGGIGLVCVIGLIVLMNKKKS